MRSSTSVAVACLAASVSAHGVVTKVTGANGVEMPGLTGKLYSPCSLPLLIALARIET